MTAAIPTRWRPAGLVLLGIVATLVTLGVLATRGGDAPTRAEQVQQLAAGLHCPICKDLSVADSPAPLAQQMRAQIARQLAAGQSPDQIRRGFVAAYGESVLMAPPKHGLAGAAYYLPVLIVVGGAAGGVLLVRRWRRSAAISDNEPEPTAKQLRALQRAVATFHEDDAEPGVLAGDDGDNYRMLLRQLRDLDDDHAVGKLTEDDHARLSAPIMREAVAASRLARREGQAIAGTSPEPANRRLRPVRWAVALVLVGAAAGVSVLLADTVNPRAAGQPISGAALPAASKVTTASSAPRGAQRKLTAAQAAAIAAAVAAVQNRPSDVAAHLALAHAYVDSGVTQLAAVEYLAITRLDPGNAEANTALALLAFETGHTRQSITMADRAVAAHPNYPEGRYVRGLIRLMGLHQPALAATDLNAYLAVAPFGSHRTAAQTLLALAGSEVQR